MNRMKIYKIIDNTNGAIYIGKTTRTLKHRLGQHKHYNDCSSKKIIENGDYRIELIEETDDDTRERYWILNTECVNVCIPGRTHKEWREKNKEKLKEYEKEWREKNKEKKQEYMKEYNKQRNKEKTKEYNKQYRKYRKSFGGDPRSDNSLLKIDIDLFT